MSNYPSEAKYYRISYFGLYERKDELMRWEVIKYIL